MGRGGYYGGSTIIRAAIGYIGIRPKMSAMEVDARRAKPANTKKKKKQSVRDAAYERAVNKARSKSSKPMKGVKVIRYTKNTLRLRKPKG